MPYTSNIKQLLKKLHFRASYRVRKRKWELTLRGYISIKESTLRQLFGTNGKLGLWSF